MSKPKKSIIEVQGSAITILARPQGDYISLTDMVRNFEGGGALIEQWLKNKDTVLFLGAWERMHNSDFNSLEFEGIRNEAGRNSFFLSAKTWIERTRAKGLVASAGRYGGTFAHKDIAFELGSWLSPEFKLYLIKEFQRLKEDENRRLSLAWNLNRTLSKLNYRKRVVQKLQTEAASLLPNDPQRQFADALGFKVYTLTKSAFPRVEFAPDPARTEAENIELLKQYIRDKEATFHIQFEKDKVLDEVLLKNGFMLDYTLTRRPEFTKNEVFLAKDAHKESLICLDAQIAPETVDHFKAHKDQFFICLELALDTTKKWNLKHHLGEKLKAF
jgi:hypothetical protein